MPSVLLLRTSDFPPPPNPKKNPTKSQMTRCTGSSSTKRTSVRQNSRDTHCCTDLHGVARLVANGPQLLLRQTRVAQVEDVGQRDTLVALVERRKHLEAHQTRHLPAAAAAAAARGVSR